MPVLPAGPAALARALETVRRGGLVILPTETFYGIACDAWSARAVERLVRTKGRAWGKPIPLVAGSLEAAKAAVLDVPSCLEPLAARFWPGPLTLVMAAAQFPPAVSAGSGTVGIRVPGPSFALDLARVFGRPLTATSANLAGGQPARSAEEVDPALAEEVDLVIDGGETPGGTPSTVLDLTVSPPRVIRAGAGYHEVEAFLRTLSPNRHKA